MSILNLQTLKIAVIFIVGLPQTIFWIIVEHICKWTLIQGHVLVEEILIH